GFHVAGPGVNTVIGGTVRLAPAGDVPVAFEGVTYRGELEVFLSRDRGLSVVNVVHLESYLRGVVPREIGPRGLVDLEAVKAQAVAARTYALARGGGRSGGDYDLHATVKDQAYAGAAAEDPTSDRAIAETAGFVLHHNGVPINAYFSSCCGGWTAAREDVWELPAEPYLISQSDVPGGGRDLDAAYCSGSSSFTWEVEWSGAEILDLVRTRLRETASTPVLKPPTAVRNIRVTERSGSGRVRWLEVDTSEGIYTVFADRVRWLLRRPGSDAILRSAWFDLDVDQRRGSVTRVRATGRGYGHGVGLCQHGALGMARKGFSYRQILEHYYPGTLLDTPAGYWE
ncbi:SpoIID/LytB domain-containing protein, partial [bacterium]|nr:SpoIID/LytB domain-containing protein [bacterium]